VRLVGRTVVRFGNAGWSGFQPADGVVHTTPAMYGPCGECDAGGAAPVHNVVYPAGTHGSWDDDGTHAATFWLPFLLEIEPFEYTEFMRLCRTAQRLAGDRVTYRLDLAVNALLDARWRWLGGASVRAFFSDMIASRLPAARGRADEVRQAISHAGSLLWQIVAEAEAAYRRGPVAAGSVLAADPGLREREHARRRLVGALNPHVAVAEALAEAMPSEFGGPP
jgi:hypothetical protein